MPFDPLEADAGVRRQVRDVVDHLRRRRSPRSPPRRRRSGVMRVALDPVAVRAGGDDDRRRRRCRSTVLPISTLSPGVLQQDAAVAAERRVGGDPADPCSARSGGRRRDQQLDAPRPRLPVSVLSCDQAVLGVVDQRDADLVAVHRVAADDVAVAPVVGVRQLDAGGGVAPARSGPRPCRTACPAISVDAVPELLDRAAADDHVRRTRRCGRRPAGPARAARPANPAGPGSSPGRRWCGRSGRPRCSARR